MMQKGMTVLLLGSGGREHALAWKMAQSALVQKLHVLPGNEGMANAEKIECVVGDVYDVARQLKPDLIVIGSEKPMAEGVVDRLEADGFTVLGPSRAAAQLETSKIFSKAFMLDEKIPTARAVTCNSYAEAMAALKGWDIEKKGVVIKADGLAAGKGVVVTHDRVEAEEKLHAFMKDATFAVKADRILLEDVLKGREVSAFALCDGEDFTPLGYICDYKRVYDGNRGGNTGGMGGFSPNGWPSDIARNFVNDRIFSAVLRGMKKRGMPFKGILFAGLMVEGDEVSVIEFNVRFGDPETQVLLPLLQSDIVPLFLAAAKGDLSACAPPVMADMVALHVVMTSEGYPDARMRLGEKIEFVPVTNDNTRIFFSGVKEIGGTLVNAAGRVLGVTAVSKTLEEARRAAYERIEKIKFDGAHWRRDIGG